MSCGVHVTVYRVRDLTHPKIKFKVDMNAQQYHLTGCVLLYKDVNLVILEGGGRPSCVCVCVCHCVWCVYVYMYLCMCVCVCVCVEIEGRDILWEKDC